MNRFFLLAIALFQVLSLSTAFVPVTHSSMVSRTAIFSEEQTTVDPVTPTAERGVSVDQDGKSNVWAIEPKMEISAKSSEEKTTSALIAGGGLAVFAVIAGVVLTNLPDPNQF